MARKDIFLAGVISSLIITLVMFLLRLVWGIPSLPEILVDRSTLFIPLSIYKIFILRLESLTKPVFLITFILVQLVLGGLLALAWIRAQEKLFPAIKKDLSHGRKGSAFFKSCIPGLIFSASLWLVMMLVFFPVLGLGFFGGRLSPGPVVISLIIAVLLVIYALSLSLFNVLNPDSGLNTLDSQSNLQRRRFINRLSLGILAVFLTAGIGAMIKALLKPPEEESSPAKIPVTSTEISPGTPTVSLTPEITPNDVFYNVSKNFRDPEVDGAAWKLEVFGQVATPLTFSLDELKKLPSVEEYRTLECISNEVGGDLIGTARWKGVPLSYFLEKASVSMYARKVVFHGADEYSDSITIDRALNPANLLAYEMNGVTLPDRHGFPARLLIPGIYGMKNVKWLTGIEIMDQDYYGYWQERGWSDSADIVIMSRIDNPGQNDKFGRGGINSISGVAFSGDQGISRVEVSQDGGKSWAPAELKDALSPYTWVLWVYNWEPLPGKYNLLVRAADKKGLLQKSVEQEPYPDGATGYHSITVRIM